MKNFLTSRNNGFGFNFFDDVFEDFFKPVIYGKSADYMKTDVKETEDAYILAVDMPGFDKKDITLSLNDGYLTIEAKREDADANDNYVRRERSFSCKRSYFVGDAVTEDDIKAKLDNGTLKIDVMKKELKELPKKNIKID